MIVSFYAAMFLLSLLLTILYVVSWQKHFDVHFSLMFAFIPVENLGCLLLSESKNLEEALTANKVIYIGACYLVLFIFLSILNLCHIHLPKGANALLTVFNTALYLGALTMGRGPWFYKSCELTFYQGAAILVKEYGPLHTLFYGVIFLYFFACLAVLIYSYGWKRDVSRRIIVLLFLPEMIAFIVFFGGRRIFQAIDLTPFAYVFAQIMFLLIIQRICLLDITDSGIDSLSETGETGLMSFDLHLRYLGSNEAAKQMLPEIRSFMVDRPVPKGESAIGDLILSSLRGYLRDESKDRVHFPVEDRIYLLDINNLCEGRRKRGYQFVVTDDTDRTRYISLLDSYNRDLKTEVEKKTEHLVEMHNRLVLGMAVMVESRDNSTGGHIRRTSDVIRILIDGIREAGSPVLSESFAADLIKAAPMHDLGKIAVDDEVLRKPGRFTPEEFEKMKCHAAEGARIVHTILAGTDDGVFQLIAENVAHYHHERWDGTGYPKGLQRDAIPLEARIMAIADVYDALVSKRVYKERMSFEKAAGIIQDGFGKHFDPSLEQGFTIARGRIEDYYRENS